LHHVKLLAAHSPDTAGEQPAHAAPAAHQTALNQAPLILFELVCQGALAAEQSQVLFKLFIHLLLPRCLLHRVLLPICICCSCTYCCCCPCHGAMPLLLLLVHLLLPQVQGCLLPGSSCC
jgi:hypothetical protein